MFLRLRKADSRLHQIIGRSNSIRGLVKSTVKLLKDLKVLEKCCILEGFLTYVHAFSILKAQEGLQVISLVGSMNPFLMEALA